MQGIVADDSDAEWDEEIQNIYGRRWRNTVWEDGIEFDAGLEMVDMVHHSFHHYDTEIQFDGRNFVNQGNEVPVEGDSPTPTERDPFNDPTCVDGTAQNSSEVITMLILNAQNAALLDTGELASLGSR